MKTRELDYDFDPSLVATAPASPRDAARLMVVDRTRGAIDHRLVRDLPSILRAGDHLFVNETSVLRARLSLHDDPRGRHTEGLLLEPAAELGAWRILVRQAKRFSDGDRLALRDATGRDHGDAVELVRRDAEFADAALPIGPRRQRVPAGFARYVRHTQVAVHVDKHGARQMRRVIGATAMRGIHQ
jgi:S-adenosylmethionine:tRNA-ribosyltransferase-isomerase (queuine synthetase)